MLKMIYCLAIATAMTGASPWEHPANARFKTKLIHRGVVAPHLAQPAVTPSVKPSPVPSPVPSPKPSPVIHSSPAPKAPTVEKKESNPGVRPQIFPDVAPARMPAKRWELIKKACVGTGISPYVVVAIQVHETGAYRSPLWRLANNPGGINWRPGYKRCWWRKRYAAFSTEEEGIKAHVALLGGQHYARAQQTQDPIEQVRRIGAAGYAEYSREWDICVKRYVRRFMSEA